MTDVSQMSPGPWCVRMLVVALATVPCGGAAWASDLLVDPSSGAGPPSVRSTLDTPPAPTGPERPGPRVKLSYRRFSIANLDATSVPLSALELDLYPVSTRWLRAAVTLDAGRGAGTYQTNRVNLKYGMAGFAGGAQYPTRGPVTPYVEGRFSAGLLAGDAAGAVAVPGSTVSLEGASAVTWIYTRGLDVGAQVATIGRLTIAGSLGWQRSTWRGIDPSTATSLSTVQAKDLTNDSFTFKLGLGI